MSAFVLVLAAGVAVGNGPGAVSPDVEQALDLRGEWSGTHECREQTAKARLAGGTLRIDVPMAWVEMPMVVTNEGAGKVSVRFGPPRSPTRPGIFKQEGDVVTICFHKDKRPTSFKTEGGQVLLTLRRVKSGK